MRAIRYIFGVHCWLLLVWSSAAAQSGVELFAATAQNADGTPDVRLRWRIKEGWFPPGGFHLYKITASGRSLVKNINLPTDDAIDAIVGPKFPTKRLFTVATGVQLTKGGIVPPIDFETPRPPSSLPDFISRKSALDGIRNPIGPFPTREQIITRNTQIGIAKAAPTTLGIESVPPPAIAPDVKVVADARVVLHLAASLKDSSAKIIGLGETDANVRMGDSVTYELVGVGVSGRETGRMAILTDFVVGSDGQPPAPAGVVFSQDEDRIYLRWNRLGRAVETRLLQASYRVTRDGEEAPTPIIKGQPGILAPRLAAAPKPIVIVAIPERKGTKTFLKEPVNFYSNKIRLPGTYKYNVTLVDGFGRVSPTTSITVEAADWRRPNSPKQVGVDLGEEFVRNFKIIRPGQKISPFVGQPTVTLAWTPGSSVDKLPVKYNIYRFDVDNPGAAVKLTATPIDGTPLPTATSAGLSRAQDLLLGREFESRAANEVSQIAGRPAPTPDELQKRTADASVAQASFAEFFSKFRKGVAARPPVTFIDQTAERDHRYVYSVTAIHPANGLESDGTVAPQLYVPDPGKPPAVTGLTSTFGVGGVGAKSPVTSKLPANSKFPGFTGQSILDRLKLPKELAPGVSPPFKGTIFKPRPTLPKPILLGRDDAGRVTLRWTKIPNAKGVRYQVRRKFGNAPTVDLGLTAADVATFTDVVPKSRERSYEYEVVAISRSGHKGFPAGVAQAVPATVAPDPPNLISAAPGAEGVIDLTIEAASVDQGVASYAIFRDGTELPTKLAAANPVEGCYKFPDTGRVPGVQHTYTVLAITAAPALKRSAQSNAVRAAALKFIAAPVTALTALVTPGTATTGPSVVLRWVAPADAAKYIVRRKVGSGQPVVLSGNIPASSLTFTDVSPTAGKSYTYEVLAVDKSGNVSVPTPVTASTQ